MVTGTRNIFLHNIFKRERSSYF